MYIQLQDVDLLLMAVIGNLVLKGQVNPTENLTVCIAPNTSALLYSHYNVVSKRELNYLPHKF